MLGLSSGFGAAAQRAQAFRRDFRAGYGAWRRAFNRLALVLLTVTAAPALAEEEIVIAALGDSLTAGYGVAPEDSFPAQLERALRERGLDVRVINAGVSGDTTAGGLSRLDWVLGDAPDYMIVALGGNDLLRAIDPKASRANLDAILARLAQEGIPTLLAGMRAPPNLGADYVRAFDGMYSELAAAHGARLHPFFLEGIATDPAFNQPDGLHPNPQGVAVMVEGILPAVLELIGEDGTGS